MGACFVIHGSKNRGGHLHREAVINVYRILSSKRQFRVSATPPPIFDDSVVYV